MSKKEKTKAVIYCRVSSTKQVREGDGLASQETRCREYARYHGHEVVEVFRDDITGSTADRRGLNAMLAFLRKHPDIVVIIDDVSRLGRDREVYWDLRKAIKKVGATLESPSIRFGEDADSVFFESLMVDVAQHQRQKNAEQTRNRMRARAMNGYWVFYPPPGYRFERVAGHGKLLVRNEPIASIIAEALEGYASGRFSSQVEVCRFLAKQPAWPKGARGEVHQTRVDELFTRPVYAGRIAIPEWDLHFIPAKHEALVSLETWQAVQRRRQGAAVAPVRKDIHEDFPLRGFVTCGHCNQPMTACWSKGRSAYYPYYLCDTRGCVAHRKSVRREIIEGDFETLLADLTPSEELFVLAFEMFRDLWDARTNAAESDVSALKRELAQIEKKVAQFLDRIVETDNRSVIAAYEARIRDLENEKALLTEKIDRSGQPRVSFDETYRTAFSFLANPCNLWASDRLEDKRAVLKLVFSERLPYIKGEGYRTAKTSLPFRALGDFRMGKYEMVPRDGVEPPTLRFSVACSTN